MSSLIDTTHLKNLQKTLSDAESSDYIHRLYEALNESYADFLSREMELFDPSLGQNVKERLHLLKNRFANLGMTACADLVTQLGRVEESSLEVNALKSSLVKDLKNKAFSSINLFFDEYLP